MLFKCNQCRFQGEIKFQLNNHMAKYHTEIWCLLCEENCSNVETFRNHAKKHKMDGQVSYYPGNTAGFHCQDCKELYKSNDSFMNHLAQVHLTEGQRQGAGLAKYIGGGYKGRGQEQKQESQLGQGQGGSRTQGRERVQDSHPPLCRNGDGCRFYKHYRCSFVHPQSLQDQRRHHPRQSPSDQWKLVPTRRPNLNNGRQVNQSHEQQSHGHKYCSVPTKGDTLVPWCLHGRGCPMRKYCVLRHEDTDFPDLPLQGSQ